MSKSKAVLLARLSNDDISKGYSTQKALQNLRKFAQANGLEVIKEFEAVEDSDFGESVILSSALDFIEEKREKIILVSEKYTTYNDKSSAGIKFRALLNAQMLEPKTRNHPCFEEPPANVKIWRYIDLPKFIDLIQTRSIYFTRADFLRQMDKQEGAAATKLTKGVNKLLEAKIIPYPEDSLMPLNSYLEMQKTLEKFNEEWLIKRNYINCWHMADFENFAMWKIYSDTFGVAIESDLESLKDSFSDKDWGYHAEQDRIYIGKVRYIDTNAFIMPQDNGFWPYLHKIREFGYEQELRCIISDNDATEDQVGIKIDVDLNKLIHKTHVSPFAPEWFKASIIDLCEKYGIDPKKVKQSNIF